MKKTTLDMIFMMKNTTLAEHEGYFLGNDLDDEEHCTPTQWDENRTRGWGGGGVVPVGPKAAHL